MACIKEVNRSASVAFAPDAPFLAAGTMAGAVDVHFSSSANLDIFKLDFTSVEHQLPLAGSEPSSESFNRLSWGKYPTNSEEFALGLIAGGLVDGNIEIWNPNALIRSEASESALIEHLSRHRGPVQGLEFSSLSPNHLASGADEGEICIWDISKPSEPTHFPPLKIKKYLILWLSKTLNHNQELYMLLIKPVMAPLIPLKIIRKTASRHA